MECPRCSLLSPEGALTCDCGYSFAPTLEPRSGPRTMTFHGGVRDAARALLAMIGFSLLIVTAAWAYARFYQWLFRHLLLSDGAKATFEGRPAQVWFSALALALLPQADRVLPRFVLNKITDENERAVAAVVLLLLIMVGQTLAWLDLCRWMAAGIRVSTGTALTFDGGAGGCFLWVFLCQVVTALLVPTRFFSLLLLPLVLRGGSRWMINHVCSKHSKLRFTGSLWQVWWRTTVAFSLSILVIPIPWVMTWLYKWAARNILIEPVTPEGKAFLPAR